jgi:hypothetical protein
MRISHQPTTFQAPYHAKPPAVVKRDDKDGHVIARIKLKNHVVAVARDMPYDLTYSGYASAEYVNGTGPSPGEYTTPNRNIPNAIHPIRAV